MSCRRRVGTGRFAVTIIVTSGGRRDELALLRRGLGVKCDKHTEERRVRRLSCSPPRRNSDRRIALSHTRYVALRLFWYRLLARDRMWKRFFSPKSATYIVAAVIPPIIAPSGSRGVSDYCPGRRTNQTTCYRSACRAPGQPANQRAGATADQGTPQHAVLPSICTSSECQCHRNHNQCSTHALTHDKRLITTADLT